jgi:hypothetical protein
MDWHNWPYIYLASQQSSSSAHPKKFLGKMGEKSRKWEFEWEKRRKWKIGGN